MESYWRFETSGGFGRISHEREGNPENKFKPGYLKVLEGQISTNLPNAELRAKPDIESRLRTLIKLSILPLFKIVVCWSNFTTVGHLIEDPQEFLKDQLITYVATSVQWNKSNFICKKEE